MADNSSPLISIADSGAALDELFKQSTPEPADPPEPKDDEGDSTPPVGDPAPDPTPAPDPDPVPEPEPKDGEGDPTPEPKDGEGDHTPEPVKDDFEEVQIPPHTKPKTAESFGRLKAIAREQVKKREEEIATLRQQIAEREEKLKTALPNEAAQELEELRTFRRSVDIENDPSFKSQFDGKIDANNKAILDRLADSGFAKEQIDKIVEMGGPEKVNWDAIREKLPGHLARFIDAKLISNEDLRAERKQAITEARKNPTQFEQKRQESRARVLTETANSFLKQAGGLAIQQIPPSAKPEEKARIEAANKIAKEANEVIQNALKDDSPETFAELAVGTALAHKFKAERDSLNKEKTTWETERKTLQAELTKVKAELDGIKKASRTHRQSSTTPPPVVADPFAVSGGDALDKLRDSLA